MDKLTIKYIAPHLPYGLKCHNMGNHDDEGTPIVQEIIGLDQDGVLVSFEHEDEHYLYSDTFPLLRPMSDLTKEIDHKGEKFVPMIRLLELKERNAFTKNERIKNLLSKDVKVIDCKTSEYKLSPTMICHAVRYAVETTNMGTLVYRFSFDEHFDRFSAQDETRRLTLGVGHQKQLFEKLYEWHFDIDGLIEKGLAIDINTLESEAK